MSQTSRTVPEDLVKQDVTNESLFCICCMERSGTFIRLASCTHKEYLESFPISNLNLDIPVVVCSKCHDILKTVTQFKKQVQNSFDIYLKKANSSEKIESLKPKLEISDTLHCNVERTDQFDNTENVSESSRKYKNISTALGIINSNAASMAALTSSQNFIGLTETLLQATTLGLNLPLMREMVLPAVNIHNSTATLTVNNTSDIIPVDANKDVEKQVNLNKSNNSLENNNMKVLKKTKNESVLELVHKTVCNTVGLKKADGHGLSVDKSKAQEMGNSNTVLVKDNNILSDTDVILDKHKIKSENIEMEIEEIKNEPDLEIVHEKFRKPVSNREAVISIHFEDKTTSSPINIKKEPETSDSLSTTTTNDNYHEENFVKPEIKEGTEDVSIVSAYGTAVLPDAIKFEPEEVEDAYIDSDTSTEAVANGHKNPNDDGYMIPIHRTLTGCGDEELMKGPGENLHSTVNLKWKYPCNHCPIGFQYKENLIDHVKRKHATATTRPPDRYLICDVCQQVVPVADFRQHQLTHYNGFFSITEKNTDDHQNENNRKRKIDDTTDDGNKKREQRLQKGRERSKRYREKKRSNDAALAIGNLTDAEKEKREKRLRYNRERSKRYREKIRSKDAALAIGGLSDADREKREERLRYNREKFKRHMEKKKNEYAALVLGGLTDADKEKREERLRYNREKTKRYREKKKNEVAALSMDTAEDDFSSDSSASKLKKERQKQHSKRYRDKRRLSNLLTPNISNPKNHPPVVHTTQVAGPSSRDIPPIFCSSQSEGTTSRDAQILPIIDAQTHNICLQTYSAFYQNSPAHRQFEKDFFENEFGHACDICDRLWFKNDLKYLQLNDTNRNTEFIRTLLSDIAIQEIQVCYNCFATIQKQRIPPLAVYNGFKYPPLPDCLKDSPLDLVTERLISPRIPFMQIRRLRHVHGQYGIYGQVINVPIEVDTMVNMLPRQMDDDHTITVNIKRKKVHKSSNVYDIVRKRKIKVWLRYLRNTPLYENWGVTVNEEFLNDTNFDVDDEIIFDEDGDNDILEQIPIEEGLISQQQTLMWNDDMYLRIAPGEGIVPKSVLFDEHAEELSFPQIYLGQFRKFRDGVSVTPFMMATSELRRSDRRGVTPQHLLYMAMNVMRIRIKESLKAYKGSTITKEQVQSDDYIHGCIETNLAFLRSIPNSAYYWAERRRDLFSMIRQYGKPTVFFTISANEIGWPKLLQLLYNLKNNPEISVEEAADLHFIEKSTLVNEDAVTCALYFNKLVNILLKILQSKRYSPFKKYRILHYFKRIEFQYNGSPRAHILAWLDNAPKDVLGNDYKKAIRLIDFLISVSAAEASGNIQLQTHKHTFTCYKETALSQQQTCRFDAPFMPVKTTMILKPMPDTENGFQEYKAKYNAIRKNLENSEYNDFQTFYDENHIASDEDYINIIRAGINRPRVFPKREPCEIWHNTFNPFIFNIVKSNTDFQFITDEYSCAAYLVEYVNKTNRSISDLQRQMIELMDEQPEFNLFDIIKNVSVNILNQTEMTSQEAAWYLLREPMSKSSTIIVYIPTIWPVERQRIKKKIKELSEEDDSSDIRKENWFDKYEKRPEDLAEVTLAQFVAKYYKNKSGDYALREELIVIRYRNYDMCKDYNEFRREMVTLHLPFRNEETELLAESRYLDLYEENVALILERRKEFESNVDIQKILEICRELSCENEPVGEKEINDGVGRIPVENPFAEFYDN